MERGRGPSVGRSARIPGARCRPRINPWRGGYRRPDDEQRRRTGDDRRIARRAAAGSAECRRSTRQGTAEDGEGSAGRVVEVRSRESLRRDEGAGRTFEGSVWVGGCAREGQTMQGDGRPYRRGRGGY